MSVIGNRAGLLFVGLFFLISLSGEAQRYEASVDLTKIQYDKLKVHIKVPEISEKTALFIFPKIVPGTYDNSAFGRFAEDFRAYDKNGKKLKARPIDDSAYKIKKAHKLASVSYWMNDTWDTKVEDYIFQPGGTNFIKGEQFVLNTFGLCGYIDGYSDEVPYQLEVVKPNYLYGATSLDRISESKTKDVFEAENYVELVDQPILYSKPDTISYMEGGAKIGIAVYSPVEEINAEKIKEMIQPITEAASYVLGNIPTDEYWFLFHFFNWQDELFTNGGGAFGALEHKKSSLYFVPTYLGPDGVDMASVKGTLYDMATHEFLHILSPLNLHSEEIAYFDFYETEMSEHLWLYEGVTEYLSIKSLLVGGLIDFDQFGKKIVGKINGAKRYKDVSFTEMSKNIIDPKMHREYANVYQKGALLALILDIKTAEVSNGKMDLIDLVLDLIDDYGIGKPFKDEELFDVITAKTAPELRDFFRKYYEGAEALPLEDLLITCGVNLSAKRSGDKYSFRPFNMEFDGANGVLIVTPGDENEVLTQPLAITKLNDEELSFRLTRSLLMNPSSDDPLKIDYLENGEVKTITVRPQLKDGDMEFSITRMEDPSNEQTTLFNKLFTSGDRD